MKVNITTVHCKRCGHKWHPRGDEVRMCPSCKSPYFDKPKANATPQAAAQGTKVGHEG